MRHHSSSIHSETATKIVERLKQKNYKCEGHVLNNDEETLLVFSEGGKKPATVVGINAHSREIVHAFTTHSIGNDDNFDTFDGCGGRVENATFGLAKVMIELHIMEQLAMNETHEAVDYFTQNSLDNAKNDENMPEIGAYLNSQTAGIRETPYDLLYKILTKGVTDPAYKAPEKPVEPPPKVPQYEASELVFKIRCEKALAENNTAYDWGALKQTAKDNLDTIKNIFQNPSIDNREKLIRYIHFKKEYVASKILTYPPDVAKEAYGRTVVFQFIKYAWEKLDLANEAVYLTRKAFLQADEQIMYLFFALNRFSKTSEISKFDDLWANQVKKAEFAALGTYPKQGALAMFQIDEKAHIETEWNKLKEKIIKDQKKLAKANARVVKDIYKALHGEEEDDHSERLTVQGLKLIGWVEQFDKIYATQTGGSVLKRRMRIADPTVRHDLLKIADDVVKTIEVLYYIGQNLTPPDHTTNFLGLRPHEVAQQQVKRSRSNSGLDSSQGFGREVSYPKVEKDMDVEPSGAAGLQREPSASFRSHSDPNPFLHSASAVSRELSLPSGGDPFHIGRSPPHAPSHSRHPSDPFVDGVTRSHSLDPFNHHGF